MDLVSSEARKTGTRGGRSHFTWESVGNNERQYYLGNSVAKPPANRRGSQPDFGWYSKPSTAPSAPLQSTTPPSATTATTDPTAAVAPAHSEPGALPPVANLSEDLEIVRRRENAIMEQMVVGRSFSEAVRSALSESAGSGVDDEASHEETGAEAARRSVRKGEKADKAQRKEVRRRVRELRRVRRTEKYQKRDKHHDAIVSNPDSSESERESIRNKQQEEASRRRRHRGRENHNRRKRREWSSTSDSDDPDRHRSRRQRLR